MTIEETLDLETCSQLLNHPDIRLGVDRDVQFESIYREDMTVLLFRNEEGLPVGLIWLDMQDESGKMVPVAHMAFTRAARGRKALKAITGATNWCFLHRDWPVIWAKPPFRRSYLLMKMLGWEDVRDETVPAGYLGDVKRKVIILQRKVWWKRIAHRPFFVTGFPRSGTAWCANLLTSGGALCLHEGTRFGPNSDIWMYSEEHRGTADPTILLNTTMVQDNCDAPVVWIKRDRKASQDAFGKYIQRSGQSINGLDEFYDKLENAAELSLVFRPNVLVIDFDKLFTVESAEKIWNHCLPNLPFDKIRAKILCGFNVQQDIYSAWSNTAPNPILAEPEPIFRALPMSDRHGGTADVRSDMF
jgi:hypothetical protein